MRCYCNKGIHSSATDVWRHTVSMKQQFQSYLAIWLLVAFLCERHTLMTEVTFFFFERMEGGGVDGNFACSNTDAKFGNTKVQTYIRWCVNPKQCKGCSKEFFWMPAHVHWDHVISIHMFIKVVTLTPLVSPLISRALTNKNYTRKLFGTWN